MIIAKSLTSRIILIAGILALFPTFALAQLPQSIDEVEALTPSQRHQILADGKIQALTRSKRMQLAAMTAVPPDLSNYDVEFYDITIRVNDTNENLYGRVKIIARGAVNGVADIAVGLFDNMTVDSIVAPSGILAYSRASNFITVTLDHLYDYGEQIEIDIWYQGHPLEGGLQAFSFDLTDAGDISISTLSEPYFAPSWWPCKDIMTDKADSFKVHIEVDTSLYVASNGTLDSTTSESLNSHAFHYTVHYPMATYLFSLAISPFVVWSQEYLYDGGAGSMPIVHHVYPDWYNTSLTTWGQSPFILEVLVGLFGEYPYLDEKYGHANFEWGGGMEHQTVTSMGGSWFGFSEAVIIHEMAHQWWGDMITCASWSDIWLNEGWASYAEALFYLETEGWTRYHNYMAGMEYYGAGTIYVTDTNNIWTIFHGGRSYDKGAWVLHMLRGVLGEEAFNTAVAAWYNSEFKHGAATTEDFKNTVEAATGVELDWFFDDWIYADGFPQYRYYYMDEPSDSGGYDIYLKVEQYQTRRAGAFGMPVDFLLEYSDASKDTVVLTVDQMRNVFRFNFPKTVTDITLDPSNWVLNSSMKMFLWPSTIITLDGDLSDGTQFRAYEDTVEYRGGSSQKQFTVIEGALPSGFTIDESGIIGGTTSDTGHFAFAIELLDLSDSSIDEVELSLYMIPGTCCMGSSMGNVDCTGIIDIGDVTVMIQKLFITLGEFCCEDEADLDLSGLVDIGDLTRLISSLFITLAPLDACP